MIKDNVLKLKNEIKIFKDVTIVAAAKYTDASGIQELVEAGIKDIGINRVDDFLLKYAKLKDLSITWHLIGNLQTRKVKDCINYLDYFHALDNLKLAQEIEKRATKKIKCFIEVNISGEETKHGLKNEEVLSFLKSIESYQKLEIIGLMTMAPNTNDTLLIRSVFSKLKYLQEELKKQYPQITKLSMGMTNDYHIALECGANFLRIGRLLIY